MPIYIGSRYENAVVDRVLGRDGALHPTAFPPVPPIPATEVQTYLVIEGDRLDQIAQVVYGRPDLWWVIAQANPDLLLPDPLVAGTTLRIPRARRSV